MEAITNNEILYQAVLQRSFVTVSDTEDDADNLILKFVKNYIASRYGK